MLFVTGVILLVGGLLMDALCGSPAGDPDNDWNKRASALIFWGLILATISVCIYAAKNMP
jgi:hypothetical protein